jgi:hypothetical protein
MAITMTMLKTTETTSGGEEKKRQLVFFNSLSEQFDPEKCTSDQKFTVNPNNEYVVMIRTLAPIPVRLLDETKQLHIASGSLLLGYNISLKQQDMTLTVGEGTNMSLLLNSGYLKMVPFFLTVEQCMALTHPKLFNPVAVPTT